MSETDSTFLQTLHRRIDYKPEDGTFFWKNILENSPYAGKPAGSISTRGYAKVYIDGKSRYAHRLAWMYVYGEWPKYDIDHINGDPLDNRIENLRDVPTVINSQNQRRAYKTHSTGLLGVSKSNNKYMARITVAGKSKFLGMFVTAKEASEAYLLAKRALHPGCTI